MHVNKPDFDNLEKVLERALIFNYNDFVSDRLLLLEQCSDIFFALSPCNACTRSVVMHEWAKPKLY